MDKLPPKKSVDAPVLTKKAFVMQANDNDDDDGEALKEEEANNRRLLKAHDLMPRLLVGWKCVPMKELPLDGDEMRARLGKAVVGNVSIRAPAPGAPLNTQSGFVVPAVPPTFAPKLRRNKPGKDGQVWRTIVRDPRGDEYWVTVPNNPDVEVNRSDLDPGPIKQPVNYPMVCQQGVDAIPGRRKVKLHANAEGLLHYADLAKEARDFLASVPPSPSTS